MPNLHSNHFDIGPFQNLVSMGFQNIFLHLLVNGYLRGNHAKFVLKTFWYWDIQIFEYLGTKGLTCNGKWISKCNLWSTYSNIKRSNKEIFWERKNTFLPEAVVGGNLCPICSLTKCCLRQGRGKYLETSNMRNFLSLCQI